MMLTLTGYAQENTSLRIVRGKADTVFTKSHFVVGVAEPGSNVYINDVQVKQYSTGSFGTELLLDYGDNPVTVRVTSGSKEVSESFSVHYKEAPATQPESNYHFNSPVVVTKKGAYLNSSSGADRLGGNKMNFLAEGIALELLGVEGNLYKVRLSENRIAFIPRQFAELAPFGQMPSASISGSWSVTNAGNADRIRIALEKRQPYIIYRSVDPNQLIIELHGTFNNSNWITQYRNLKAIDYVHLNQVGSDVLQVVVNLKDKYSWGYSVDYVGNSLEILVKHTPKVLYERSRNPLAGLVIGLDAGHGGPANGAVSPSGIREKDLNLDMVMALKEMIEKKGGKVVLSRSEDVDVPMQQRGEIFRNGKVDLMVSVHCNAGGNPLRPMGTSTYYRHVEYRPLAKTILNRLMELEVGEFGLVGNFNFSMNAPTDFPTVLVETLFMSSLPDEELLASPKFRREMMEKVVLGLEEYISVVRKSL